MTATLRNRRSARQRARQKGNEIQRRAVHVLESLGFQCDVARPDVRWIPERPPAYPGEKVPLRPMSMSHDILGVGDLIVVCTGECSLAEHPRSQLWLVQCTTPENFSSHVKTVQARTQHWACKPIEIWVWYGGRQRAKDRGDGQVLAQCFRRYDVNGRTVGFIYPKELGIT